MWFDCWLSRYITRSLSLMPLSDKFKLELKLSERMPIAGEIYQKL